jgi:hypothetical protein
MTIKMTTGHESRKRRNKIVQADSDGIYAV